jgi:hypothetical protein
MTLRVTDIIAEMRTEGLRPASTHESGWYWRSVDGRMYWVTAL